MSFARLPTRICRKEICEQSYNARNRKLPFPGVESFSKQCVAWALKVDFKCNSIKIVCVKFEKENGDFSKTFCIIYEHKNYFISS